jgi:hypothetical protein
MIETNSAVNYFTDYTKEEENLSVIINIDLKSLKNFQIKKD